MILAATWAASPTGANRHLLALGDLGAQPALELGQSRLELALLLLGADHVLAVALEEVADRLDADLDRARRLVLVDVLEAEVRRARLLDDLLDGRVDGRIVAALERAELQRD